jgi:rare lipoprotein A
MRRTTITIAALVAFAGLAEARPWHHYNHHNRGHGYSYGVRHLHFRGHYPFRHHAASGQRRVLAAAAPAAQSSFGTSAQDAGSSRAASAAGRLVRASWYGGGERLSSHTASGERFDRGGLTAAHRSLPFGTRVSVTNVQTGASVVVRINDRGPYVRGRSLDLAHGAARAIGLASVGQVRMVVLN